MSIYDTLNPTQQEAVRHNQGPLLILAGAGSGKTRVLTHRIAYLIEEEGINPWNILAITFTNKAAGEMRERVDNIVSFGAEDIWVSTFHSTCVRILRRYIDRLGYDKNFTIYDSDDQKVLMRNICKHLNVDTKIHKERSLLGAISSAKDTLTGPDELLLNAGPDYGKQKIAQVYKEYQKNLKGNNALDFDDLICLTVELFRTQPDALEYYQNRFKYIMVDEYQDTNTAQFKLISLLASRYRNLCVVGDDDQSIYKFRGANIYNILNFEKEYPDAKVIKLEQNYRSTQNILNAANGVIHNNAGRKDKTLWTSNDEGEKIIFDQYNTEYEEAEGIVADIAERVREEGISYKDCAILYRTNAQSRVFEERFVIRGIPYRIIGGQNFYQRREIKDLLCYLKTIDNAMDDIAIRRIINVPKRGIGLTTVTKISDFAVINDLSFFEALENVDMVPGLGKTASKIHAFVNMIHVFRAKLEYGGLAQLLQDIIDETGYIKDLEVDSTEEAEARIENIDELMNKMVAYDEEHEHPDLSEFLEEVSLVADIDSLDNSTEKVVLMTLHSAKGLEFPYVYLGGMEDGLFPSYMSIVNDDSLEIEEERRLAYVGITRAMKQLTLSCAKTRMVHGSTQYNKVSRFVKEIPRDLIAMKGIIEKEKLIERFSNAQSMHKPYQTEDNILPFRSASALSFGTGSPASAGKKATSLDELLKNHKVFKGGTVFDKPKPAVSSTAGLAAGSASEPLGLDYTKGDRVSHIKFGEGTVISVTEKGSDYEVTVNFDRAGVRKMAASFARLKTL